MEIILVKDKIHLEQLKKLAKEGFGELVKTVVDVENEVMVVGGEWHSEAESLLLQNGSKQENLWGVNLYPFNVQADFIAFQSLINIRPRQNNRQMMIQDDALRDKIRKIIYKLVVWN